MVSLPHGLGILKWTETTAKKTSEKLIDVEQPEKTVQLITGEIVFSIMSNELSIYLIWILRSQWILSSNQANAILWVWDTCLIVGLLSFKHIFDDCFKSFRNMTSKWESSALVEVDRLRGYIPCEDQYQRDIFRFDWMMRQWSLILTLP